MNNIDGGNEALPNDDFYKTLFRIHQGDSMA